LPLSPKYSTIPVIDLFAGPGGLGEGFSSVNKNSKSIFDIKLSIEKDPQAHSTLELRSFYRKFSPCDVPEDYYQLLKADTLAKREKIKKSLFEQYPKQAAAAKNEAWLAELGADGFPPELVDQRIESALNKSKQWLLIGGPPCQAYSLVGRSRVGGINNGDNRVYLYKEYLRIIAQHQPTVFVMENVKGLLSAKINDEHIFEWILRDLRNPSSLFPKTNSYRYKIFSLSYTPSDYIDEFPSYKENSDYIIKSEKYGIPQRRHRVILLGIREDVSVSPHILKQKVNEVSLKDVIGDLPKIRSALNREFISYSIINNKKKRQYKQVKDSYKTWSSTINTYKDEICTFNGFVNTDCSFQLTTNEHGRGSEFIKYDTPSDENPLKDWFNDPRLNGVCNHESRAHLTQDLKRYLFSSMFTQKYKQFPRLHEYTKFCSELMPDHENANTGKFADRFRVQLPDQPATTVTSHISKDGHYFIHYDQAQCRSLTVREAARIQTFPDNYLFYGSRTAQFHQVGNAVPPYLASQIAIIVKDIFEANSLKTKNSVTKRTK